MSAEKNRYLIKLAEQREGYKAFVEAVERDLQLERAQRLATYRSEIEATVVQAYVSGARVADLKRAYDTKDHKTIRSILDKHAAQVALLTSGAATDEVPTNWFNYDPQAMILSVILDGKDATFAVISMEDEEYLLDYQTGDASLKSRFDGAVLSRDDTAPEMVALWTEVNNK